jgi:hypothetical protein
VGEFSPRSIWLMALMDRPHRSASALKDNPCWSRRNLNRLPTFGSEFIAITIHPFPYSYFDTLNYTRIIDIVKYSGIMKI